MAIVPAMMNGKTMLKEKALEVYNDCKRKQRTARGGIWKNWEVKMLRDDEGVPNNVGLECNECKEVHTYSNPSQTNATHWRNGKCQTREKRRVALIAGEADGAARKKAKMVQSTFDDFTAKPAVAEFARSQIAKFIFSNSVALMLIEDPYLKRACSALGVKLPSRKELSEKILDEEVESSWLT